MRLRNNPLLACALLSLMLTAALPVAASTSTSPQEPTALTLGELEELHTRNLLLQAKVQAAQLQRQLDENQSGNKPASTPVPGTAIGYTSLPAQSSPVSAGSTRPVVLEVNGRDKNLRATLQLPSGQTLVVAPGNRIPGLEQSVRSISLAGVTLSDGSLLAFGD
ncbi:type IV pilus biogenesis protein PilP [Leclercia adecarboxylata]|uniref:type IV pilus biogenesis protein PilP n=1 Tax=Leclercia adecarboxylata TaxID=83655 RepID=UPI0006896F77|nr:type IV pilus biogenesis protein PilP [Leclercia adecarboxylata]